MTVLKQSVVMGAPLNVASLMNDQARLVHGYLSFDGVPFLFAAVMRFPLVFGFWPGNLLLRRVQKRFESWKQRFNFL